MLRIIRSLLFAWGESPYDYECAKHRYVSIKNVVIVAIALAIPHSLLTSGDDGVQASSSLHRCSTKARSDVEISAEDLDFSQTLDTSTDDEDFEDRDGTCPHNVVHQPYSDTEVRTEPAAGRKRQRSLHAQCQPTAGPRDDPSFLSRVQPCGTLASICTDIPLVEANTDYPGGGVGEVRPDQDYLVQFDIGIHPEVARNMLKKSLKEADTCLHCPAYEEKCLEVVVTGGAMWGNLSLAPLGEKVYNCMGSCGRGCPTSIMKTKNQIGALDCLKHDVCSAWKSVRSGRPTKGYCNDPDCGDEAAMALFNCWKGWRLFGSIGGNRKGPLGAVPAVCDQNDPAVRGCWSHGGWFTQGRCKQFQGWDRGQGIPDPHPLRSPIQRF